MASSLIPNVRRGVPKMRDVALSLSDLIRLFLLHVLRTQVAPAVWAEDGCLGTLICEKGLTPVT